MLDRDASRGLADQAPVSDGRVLRAVRGAASDGRPVANRPPLIPLLDTTLLTNAPGEPRVGHQVLTEIHSADRIDVVMAFIRRSGIAPLLDALARHCAGRAGAARADDDLHGLDRGAGARRARETSAPRSACRTTRPRTRLHAKAWLFHRRLRVLDGVHRLVEPDALGAGQRASSGTSASPARAIRASSTRSPRSSRATGTAATSCRTTRGSSLARDRARATSGPHGRCSARSSCGLEPFQERLLEQIALSRERGHHRNLLVSATGTGKTVMAAIDYARLRERAAARAPAVRRAPRGDPRAEPGDLPPRAARPRLRRAVGRR